MKSKSASTVPGPFITTIALVIGFMSKRRIVDAMFTRLLSHTGQTVSHRKLPVMWNWKCWLLGHKWNRLMCLRCGYVYDLKRVPK